MCQIDYLWIRETKIFRMIITIYANDHVSRILAYG